jgi:hypothetical protein
MSHQIDLRQLRDAVNAILDHVIEDLGRRTVEIESGKDLYWHVPAAELHEMSRKPVGTDVGRLSDDVDFMKLIRRGQSGDVSHNLVSIAPLLRYIGEHVKS